MVGRLCPGGDQDRIQSHRAASRWRDATRRQTKAPIRPETKLRQALRRLARAPPSVPGIRAQRCPAARAPLASAPQAAPTGPPPRTPARPSARGPDSPRAHRTGRARGPSAFHSPTLPPMTGNLELEQASDNRQHFVLQVSNATPFWADGEVGAVDPGHLPSACRPGCTGSGARGVLPGHLEPHDRWGGRVTLPLEGPSRCPKAQLGPAEGEPRAVTGRSGAGWGCWRVRWRGWFGRGPGRRGGGCCR
jgi:hypothetical protein